MDNVRITPLNSMGDEEIAGVFDSCWQDVEPNVLMHGPLGYRRVLNWLDVEPRDSGIAYLSGEPAGVVLTGIRDPDRGYIASLAVKAGLRGKGIGRRLMKWAIARARMDGCRTIGLHVFEANDAAINLYASMGFAKVRRVGHWEGHIRGGNPGSLHFSYLRIEEAASLFYGEREQPLWESELKSLTNMKDGIISVLAQKNGAPFGYMAYSTRSLCWILDMRFTEGTDPGEAGELLYIVPTARFLPAVFTTIPEGSDNERIVKGLGLKLERSRLEMKLTLAVDGIA